MLRVRPINIASGKKREPARSVHYDTEMMIFQFMRIVARLALPIACGVTRERRRKPRQFDRMPFDEPRFVTRSIVIVLIRPELRFRERLS